MRHAGAQREPGKCFSDGIETEVKFMHANKYYKAAAEAGDVDSLAHYGHSMLSSRGMRKNERTAINLLKIASGAVLHKVFHHLFDIMRTKQNILSSCVLFLRFRYGFIVKLLFTLP